MRVYDMVAPIREVRVAAYAIPTDAPASDGMSECDRTTLVVVEIDAGAASGLGYTFADVATAHLIRETLAPVVLARDAMNIPAAWSAMVRAIRTIGRSGVASMAISAVDVALWDLKASLLGMPLVSLLGAARSSVAIYGSGGFTSYDDDRFCAQLQEWAERGIPRVKMKVGRDAPADRRRVALARRAIGRDIALFVDANGGYTRKEALAQAEAFAEANVTWFEEPVSADDTDGLRFMRDRAPPGMAIAAGEDGSDLPYFRRMLEEDAVDVLQADASRCGGVTGFLAAAALCDASGLPVSGHRAPALHLHVACAAPSLMHLEYFHDHARIEELLFDGVPRPKGGALAPDLSRPGIGLTLKRADAARFRVAA
jgi:L-alanine-DL-glutamate epimerase-like enolase superfamily enzyme